MFERFTTSAREVVRGAVRQADETGGTRSVEPELLLALLDRPGGSRAADAVTALGATARRASIERALADVRRRGGLPKADAEALAGLGIDVTRSSPAWRRSPRRGALAGDRKPPAAPAPFRPRGQVGPGAVAADRARTRRQHIGDEHLLLALLARPGVAANVLADHDVTYVQAERVLATRARAADGPAGAPYRTNGLPRADRPRILSRC